MENQAPAVREKKRRKVALVHDFLMSYGGAERVFEQMAGMFPEAPIYTLLADPKLVARRFPGRKIRTSWLSELPNFLKKRYRFFLPFFPVAVESFDLRDFDTVLSSSGAWSKGIITRLHTRHIAYLHSPMRYAWDYHEEYLRDLGARGKRRLFTRLLVSYLRVWDRQAALRPDVLIANSRFTAERIRKYYQRESVVIYPGGMVLAEHFPAEHRERKHFLVVARLTPAKKISAVIEAVSKLGLPLVVVGEGPERARLEKMASQSVHFTGFVEDVALARLYQEARALIFPSEEDFGLTAVEALSFGTPVIGLEYGGLKEIAESDVTGEFFHLATPELIAEGIRRFLLKEGQYDETALKRTASRFRRERFQTELRKIIDQDTI